jgi:hypothetical protein
MGVVYVTAANALVVHRYAHGDWLPGGNFDSYYRRLFLRMNNNRTDLKEKKN